MKSRLLLLIFLLCLFTLLLTGCFEISIDIGIDRGNTAYLSYKVELDVSEIDPQHHSTLSRALNSIGWHYQQELGFTAGLDTESTAYILTMSKRVDNNNFKTAFESLKTMLTDEDITAFMTVDMAIESFPRQELYLISAMLDFPKILSLSSAEELPAELMSGFDTAIETSKGTVTLTFPVSEVLKNTHEIKMQHYLAKMVVPLSFSDQTEFELAASLIFMEDGAIGASFEHISDDLVAKRNIALLVCAIAGVILLVGLIAIFARK